ncbi:ferrous iron transport protein A [candidate division WOR-3 bacterium]|uniref:Ferrous iron transport protein A n=1 Tax=candidate division WOR-3 bacterium TaxID=2052148 RepID=A0A660SJQ6_UNCW3|nr:MAG: ferrous iron transport protein A [candidate division WOR-3 bacterium]
MMTLTELKPGDEGIVMGISGGRGMMRKLESLGIRIGVKIKKISSQLMGGPVIVQVGNTRVAIGYGMAHRILIRPVG